MNRKRMKFLAGAALLVLLAAGGSTYYWFEMGGRAARLARSDDPNRRLAAVHELWGRRSGWAMTILARLGEDPHTPVAVEAIRAMGQAGGATAGSALREIIARDARPAVRAASAGELGRCPDALPDLLVLLKAPEAEVRAGAAKGLAGVRDRQAVEPLMKALEDPDQDVRVWAATALHKTVRMPIAFQAEASDDVRRRQIDTLRATLASVALAEKHASEGPPSTREGQDD